MEEMNLEILAGLRERWPTSCEQSNPTSSVRRQFELDKMVILPEMTPCLSWLFGKALSDSSCKSRGTLSLWVQWQPMCHE